MPDRGALYLALTCRPEKEHSKQLYALQILLQRYPEYRSTNPVKLTLMGGVRDEGDQKRLDGLKALAVELGIQVRPSSRTPCLSSSGR